MTVKKIDTHFHSKLNLKRPNVQAIKNSYICVCLYRGAIPEEQTTCRTPLFERDELSDSLDYGLDGARRNDSGSCNRAIAARNRRAQNKRSISLGAEAALLSQSASESDETDSDEKEEDDDGYEEGKIS